MSDAFASRRRAGILLPLFSLRGAGDWGIGDLGDLPGFCAWLADAGHRTLQLLPLFEMGPHERSPYAALTAFAIDPLYVALPAVEDFATAGGEAALPAAIRDELAAVRSADGIPYARIRRVKRAALELAHDHFLATERAGASARWSAFEAWRAEHAAWLDDYTLFRALREAHAERAWTDWDPALARRDASALATATTALARRRGYHAWVQWVAAGQWRVARAEAEARDVQFYGDLPFLVSGDSADVWAGQRDFALDASVGAPPDAFDPEGQDWGLPPMRWDTMAAGGYAWWRARLGRTAELFHGARIDHVVGYYRMWRRPHGGAPAFEPAEESAQRALGETLLGTAREAAVGCDLLAEDLGVIPDFVRDSLHRLAVPGYRVLRWEDDGGVFRDPLAWPACSLATTGTHDTSALATWWTAEAHPHQREALARVPVFGGLADAVDGRWTPDVHRTLLDGLYASGSALALVPFIDAYGGTDRINVPSTVSDANWAYRMPWSVSALRGAEGAPLRDALRALAARHGRV